MKNFVGVCLWMFTLASVVKGQGTQPLVAVHDSELTRALEFAPATNGTPIGAGTTGFQWWPTNWHYFVMPDSVKEALRSDGTPFVVLSDTNISAGALLNGNGTPKYPILISLASEAVRDDEIAQLTNYVAAGGTMLVGSSAFTRATNGASRGDFAFANAMGIHMVHTNMLNWTLNQTLSKVINHPLVAHIPGSVVDWNMPVSADEISWGISPGYQLAEGHLCWLVQATNAVVIAQGDTSPFLVTQPFGKGAFIYDAAMQPLLGHGGNAPGMYAYGIFRNAIQAAFAAANLPIPKLSPWPYAYDAALSVRHDLENLQGQISTIATSAQFEFTNGAKGDYYFCTGTLRVEMTNSAAVIAGLRQAVTNFGATIGPHNGGLANSNNPALVLSNYDFWHWATDEALDLTPSNLPTGFANGAAYGFTSTSNSFQDVEGWLAGITNGLRLTVAPHFNATREASYQIEQQLGINATGEQDLGPFPSWVLSTSLQTPDLRYPFISLPTSDWYVIPPVVAEAMESGYGVGAMRQLVDYYYNLGALVNLYSHSSSAGTGVAGTLASAYVTYAMGKPRIWPANAAGVYTWWLARSNVQVAVSSYTTNSSRSVVTYAISGAADPRTAVEVLVPGPSVSALQVLTNHVVAGTNSYRTNGPVIKLLVGTTVTNAQVTYLVNPQVQSNFYTVTQGGVLSISRPGILANALPGSRTNLTAMLASGPTDGTLSLSNNGGFSYTPQTSFSGIDSFTYQANNGLSTSGVARATIDVPPAGSVFYDNFARSTNADPLAPWVPVQGTWTIAGGMLQGSNTDPGTYNDAYVAGSWTNISLQGQVRFPPNGSGAGLDGRVNSLTGARYTLIVYPEGSPVASNGVAVMRLLKFHAWEVLGPSAMLQVSLPAVGTNWHTLQVSFRGNQVLGYFDGTEVLDVADNGFDGLPFYTSGGIGCHFWNYSTPYVVSFENVLVSPTPGSPLAVNSSYTTYQGRTLSIAPPGVLSYDAPGVGTNLFALLVSGPTNGTLNLNSNGGFSYTPVSYYVGSDSFNYQAYDGVSSSTTAVVSLTIVSNNIPVATNGSYAYTMNTTLSVAPPGVLVNDSDADGDPLTAVLVSGPTNGTLSLSSNGGFTYTPATNFNGIDGFTYVASDGSADSQVASVTLVDLGFGSFFYDNFARLSDPGPLDPWVAQTGAWTVTGGVLQGGNDSQNSYGNVYLTNSWTDYAVQGRFQFSAGAYGGGVGGRLNAATGAHYALWIYPSANNLNLIKFTSWTAFSILATVNLPVVGTNWHTAKLGFAGNQIAAYYDGQQLTNLADLSGPYLSGAISVDMFTAGTAYDLSVGDVVVEPLAMPDSYFMNGDTTLTVTPPGVLGNDTGIFGTNLTAVLLSGPTNGALNLNSNGGFIYTPTRGFTGSDSFTYQASDPQTNLGSATVSLTINSIIYGPILPAQTNLTVNELTLLTVTNTATDVLVPPEVVSYQLVYPPTGAQIDTNGVITWTPAQGQALTTNVITTVATDNGQPPLSATNSFTVFVGTHNGPSLPAQTNLTINELTTLVVDNTANDTDVPALTLSYRLTSYPAGAAISPNGTITWTPSQAQALSTNVIATVVSDNGSPPLSASNSFTVVVNDVLSPPVLPPQTNETILALGTLVVTNTASESDMRVMSLTYALVNAPTNAMIDTNGIITWAPVLAQVPSTNLFTTVATAYDPSAANAQQMSATNSFVVVDSAIHNGPSLPTQNNQVLNIPATLVVTNTAYDVDVPYTSLAYTLVNPPFGARIDTNGVITWTPYPAQAPSTNLITTVVSDNGSPSLSASNSFSVAVLDLPFGALFCENFAQVTQGPIAPWVAESGAWSVTGGVLHGGTDAQDSYGSVYLTNSWGDYAVQAQLQFATGAYGGGLGGRLNPATGARYALWIYPSANTFHLVKFTDWTAHSFLTSGTLPTIGTNAHVLRLAFRGNQIAAYYDGSLLSTATDNASPYLSGGLAVDMYTLNTAYLLSLAYVLVDPLAMPDRYLMTENTALTVAAPGVLGNDTGVAGTNLSAVLVGGPAYGALSLSSNGGFSYTPSTNFVGTDSFSYQSSDAQANLGTATATIAVYPVGNGPALRPLANQTINELATLTVTNTAGDSEMPAPVLSYQLINAPTGAQIDTNGIITWIPSQAQAPSTNLITTVVSDNGSPSLSATNSFTVVVNDLNSPPLLPAQANWTIVGLASLTVTNSATDPDIHVVSLTYTLINAPTNATIDTNGIIRWTPVVAQVPSTNLISTVAADYDPLAVNGQTLSATNNFTVVVSAIHNGPVLPAQPNRTVNELTALVVTNTASDTDLPALTLNYVLIAPPAGATIDANGLITWTPSQAQAPSTNAIITVVSDNGSPSLSATNSFTVVVAPPPVIRAISVGTGAVTITWSSAAGNNYRLQYKNTLADTNWNDLAPDITAGGSTTTATNVVSGSAQRFYRVRLLP